MAECWFDTATGEQIIGEAAGALRMEQAGAAVVPLPELITAKDFPYTAGDFTPADVDDWRQDDYINYGRWVTRLVAADGEPQPVTSMVIGRLHTLGIGPSRKRINTRFGTMSAYKEAIGSPVGYDRVRFADWGTEDFVHYALKLERSLGHAPGRDDYQAAFKAGRGPSQSLIKDRFGGTTMLNELIGHPNIDLWSKEDFIAWGVRVLRANPGLEFIDKVSKILSRRRRGPSEWSVAKHFGGWSSYRTLVTVEFAAQEKAKQERITTYRHMARRGELPEDFADMPPDELLPHAAKYILTRRCAPDIASKRQRTIAASAPRSFIGALRKVVPHVSAGHIETTAIMLGVFDDVWPMDESLSLLTISEQELDERRAHHAAYARTRRAAGNLALVD